MDAAFTVVLCQCRLANLILNGHPRRAVVSVMPQSLPAAAVPPETRSRPSSYCMVAAVMSLELHGWGNHAPWSGAAEAVNADRAGRGRADRAGPGLREPREMTAKPHPRRAEPTRGVEDEPVRLR